MGSSLSKTEWDAQGSYPRTSQQVPTHGIQGLGGEGTTSLSVQGQGVLGSSGLARPAGLAPAPRKDGQLWGTGPRSAGTAAITSGLERAAWGGDPCGQAPGRQTQQPERRRHVRGREAAGSREAAVP